MRYAALLALLFANSAFATGLDDLRGALAALQGQGTLRGTYEVRQQTTDLDGKDKTPDSGSAVAQVEDDASGLTVRWDRAAIRRANEQAWAAKGGKKGQALSTLIGSTSALRVAGAVNYAPSMLHALEGAQRDEQGTAKGLGSTSQYRNTYTFTPKP